MIALSLAATPVALELTSVERAALSRPASALEELRAGATPLAATLTLDERQTLRFAEQRATGLENLRAGALTDRELIWLLVGIAIVVLIIVL